ncbi:MULTISPECIES: hypothetical protein [unclassified Pseudoalteromonas]|uniref:hypothetical protein n=1 Tax=unclassified Pseudoalteromonas TaxID=194690 RepID=UPI0015FE52E2|nr:MULTISPECIES: hypothetical protein [unclassified Pseudoalteromonas]MBB1291012.1 hypothetical protein [Pseudoalteromonas sp. SR41-5]MBB1307787.1 hypothetical protein [Pseudoalteromonas sp. SR43-5]MBB1415286.1 hypothetical protein [Pseudoalteromonas sp. SG43-8]
MNRAIFNTMGHHAHMYVMYKGAKHYVIASNLNEGLFALIDSKTDTPPELWQWVRCESVELIKTGVVLGFTR